MIYDTDNYPGRKFAALRGDTRDRLDSLLTHEFSGTGIGRSAFIQAAVTYFQGFMTEDQQIDFATIATFCENELSR